MHADPSQLSAFDDDGWWDPEGFLYGLHTLVGPLRNAYVIDTLRGSGTPNGSRILDIGSGGGFLTATLSGAGYVVIGIDPAMSAVRDAAKHVCSPFALATGENLPFADESFDSVVCSEVLEHVGDANAVMVEASRVLRPGGALVFSLPNRTLLSKLIVIDLAQHNRITRVLPHDLHEWGRFIGSRDLSNIARRHDMVVQDVRGVSIQVRDVPTAALAMVALRRSRISYAEAGSRVRLHLSRSRAVAYVGYALKAPNG